MNLIICITKLKKKKISTKLTLIGIRRCYIYTNFCPIDCFQAPEFIDLTTFGKIREKLIPSQLILNKKNQIKNFCIYFLPYTYYVIVINVHFCGIISFEVSKLEIVGFE